MSTANPEISSQNAVVEKISTLKIADRHSTELLEDVAAETEQPQLLPPSLPRPHDEQAESSAADKIISTLPYNDLTSTLTRPRSKVLLVEDNAINMKVGLQILFCPDTNIDMVLPDYRPLHENSKTRIHNCCKRS
jgi:hypothetical protein